MRSTFFGLNIAQKGIQTQQRALDITSHNIANANTEGYTRQEAIMASTRPVKVQGGYVGTGVEITEYRRIRDQFLDVQLRTENKSLGEWDVKSDILGKLEIIFNEPTDSSLRKVMDEFWQSWQDLSKDPQSVAIRDTVMQWGVSLTEAFNHIDTQFTDLQKDINSGLSVKVDEINSIGRQISDINMQIIKAEADGSHANDLRDKRDLLIEQLSRIADVGVSEDEFGSVNVSIGGRNIVTRNFTTEIKFTDNEVDATQAKLTWVDPLTGLEQGEVIVYGGELKGYVTMRDEVVTSLQDKIDNLVSAIAQELNDIHNTGYALDDNLGLDFFTRKDDTKPFSAGNIKINELIQNNTNLIAAGKTTPVLQGDGSNALEIAQLKDKLIMNTQTASFDDYYRSTVAQLGVDAMEAERMLDNQQLLADQIKNKREGISGVSLDEEMTNMIRYQHAYSASARVVNVMDEMLDLIVNRLGMVGR